MKVMNNGLISTYGGDTVLRLAKDPENDPAFLGLVIDTVTDTHIKAGALEAGERAEFIQREINAKFPDAI